MAPLAQVPKEGRNLHRKSAFYTILMAQVPCLKWNLRRSHRDLRHHEKIGIHGEMIGRIPAIQGIVTGIGNRRDALSPIIDKVYPMVGRRRFPLPGIKRSLRPGGQRNGAVGIGPVGTVDGAAGIGLIGVKVSHKE